MSVVKLSPLFYMHVLNRNTNLTQVVRGPHRHTLLTDEVIVQQPQPMLVIGPQQYALVENPVKRNEDGTLARDPNGQVLLRHGGKEVFFHQNPFPLYPGQNLVGTVRELRVIPANSALLLCASMWCVYVCCVCCVCVCMYVCMGVYVWCLFFCFVCVYVYVCVCVVFVCLLVCVCLFSIVCSSSSSSSLLFCCLLCSSVFLLLLLRVSSCILTFVRSPNCALLLSFGSVRVILNNLSECGVPSSHSSTSSTTVVFV
jgi:Major Vault Protein repeat domain